MLPFRTHSRSGCDLSPCIHIAGHLKEIKYRKEIDTCDNYNSERQYVTLPEAIKRKTSFFCHSTRPYCIHSQAFIQADLLMPIFEQRLSFRML